MYCAWIDDSIVTKVCLEVPYILRWKGTVCFTKCPSKPGSSTDANFSQELMERATKGAQMAKTGWSEGDENPGIISQLMA